jgi:hypothetical protein
MKELRQTGVTCAVVFGWILASLQQAHAVDLTGAWATNAEECRNVFVRKGKANQITFAPGSEVRGGGFIVEQDQLRGRFAKCKVKAKKDDGQTVNIVAGCATDIMLSDVQFALKVVDENNIIRLFPGMEEMQINYYRCPI